MDQNTRLILPRYLLIQSAHSAARLSESGGGVGSVFEGDAECAGCRASAGDDRASEKSGNGTSAAAEVAQRNKMDWD